jgi:hypothetical protein
MGADTVGQWLEGAERAREKLAELRPRAGRPVEGMPKTDWERSLHLLLGAPWPCREEETFSALWAQTLALLEYRGLTVGRGAYCGWDDGDRGLARAAWCLTRHLAPVNVVETGVARGLTTGLVLQALASNGAGHLWSIDLPPWRHHRALAGQAAVAVPRELTARWTLINGSSRRRLPPLLDELGAIDLFIHDSSHSYRNMSFEVAQAWRALRPGSFLLVDDVHRNSAFEDCAARFGPVSHFTCPADDGQGMFGVIRKPAAPAPTPNGARAPLP